MAELQRFIDDLCAESDSLDALVADLPDSRWADPTPAEGWTIAHQIAHCLDRRGRAPGDHRPRRLHRATDGGRRRTRAGFVDDGAEETPARPPAELLAAWRAARAELARGARRRCRRDEDPLVRPADERGLDGDRPADGDLGARPGRRRRALGVDARPPRGCGTSPTSASAPATSPTPSTNSPPPAEAFRVELTAPDGRRVDVGPRGRRAAGHRARRWTSACSSPSARHRADLALVADRRGRRRSGSTSPRPSPARPARARWPRGP